MALLSDPEWTIRQLRIQYLRSDDGLAERLITFPPPQPLYQPVASWGSQPGLSQQLPQQSSVATIAANSLSQMSLSTSQSQYLGQTGTKQPPILQPLYSYCTDPVPERSMCYSPNLTSITSDLTAVGGGGYSGGVQSASRAETGRHGAASRAKQQQQVPAVHLNDRPAAVTAVADIRVNDINNTLTEPEPPVVITPTTVAAGVFSRVADITTMLPPPASALSAVIRSKSSSKNPFAADYSFICGKGEAQPVKLRIYFPHSQQPRLPLAIMVKRDASVEEVIGYSMYEYVEAKRQPLVETVTDGTKVASWNLRIVEDDGTIDEDFPALERQRRVQKFSFDAFAICAANPKQVKAAKKVSTTIEEQPSTSITLAAPKKPGSGNYLIKVHLYSTLEVKQTTTVNLSGDMLLSEVLDLCCRKRKIDSNDYTLKMADTKTDVPLDRTLGSLGLEEVCLLKKDRGPSAGDIFLRPPEEADQDSEYDQQPTYRSDEYTSVYKKYNVTRKMPKIMGRQERVLAIDGDYIYIMPSENRNLFDSVKTTSFHINAVLSCKQLKKFVPAFKLICQRDRDVKIYEFEASSPQEAHEICSKVHFMSQFNKPSATK